MLSKQFRFTPFEFYHRVERRKKINFSLGSVAVRTTKNNFPRFCIIVPYSLDKRSSHRHQAKRVFIEAIQTRLADFPPQMDFLFKLNRILKKSERKIVEKEIEKMAGQIIKISRFHEKNNS